jgi:molybdenum cofactor guanylyltransferase
MAREQDQFLDVVDRDTAERRWWAALRPAVLETEEIVLGAALARVLAIDVAAPVDVPPFDRSNVDGFAVQAQDTFGAAEERPRELAINDREVTTGCMPTTTLQPGCATSFATTGSGGFVMSLGAVVLCGGESRRMGRPKAWLPFGAELMLERVVRLAGTVARPIVVVAAPSQELPTLPACVVIVRDQVSGRGPLQGLAAGLAAFDSSVDLVYATATDVPFLEPRWMTRMVELSSGYDLVIPRVAGFYHPLAALYRPAAVLPAIESLLVADRLRPVFLVDAVKTRVVDEDEMRTVDPTLDTLRNLNHPEDYKRALADAGLA